MKPGTSHSVLSLWLAVGFSLATGLVSWATSERTRVIELTALLRLEAD
jgi:hypothetical protein